jgi:hypothetical protein
MFQISRKHDVMRAHTINEQNLISDNDYKLYNRDPYKRDIKIQY